MKLLPVSILMLLLLFSCGDKAAPKVEAVASPPITPITVLRVFFVEKQEAPAILDKGEYVFSQEGSIKDFLSTEKLDITYVTKLIIEGTLLTSLDGLLGFSEKLEELSIEGPKVANIKDIFKCTHIKALSLKSMKLISSIPDLSLLKELKRFTITNTALKEFDEIRKLTYCEYVYFTFEYSDLQKRQAEALALALGENGVTVDYYNYPDDEH